MSLVLLELQIALCRRHLQLTSVGWSLVAAALSVAARLAHAERKQTTKHKRLTQGAVNVGRKKAVSHSFSVQNHGEGLSSRSLCKI